MSNLTRAATFLARAGGFLILLGCVAIGAADLTPITKIDDTLNPGAHR